MSLMIARKQVVLPASVEPPTVLFHKELRRKSLDLELSVSKSRDFNRGSIFELKHRLVRKGVDVDLLVGSPPSPSITLERRNDSPWPFAICKFFNIGLCSQIACWVTNHDPLHSKLLLCLASILLGRVERFQPVAIRRQSLEVNTQYITT